MHSVQKAKKYCTDLGVLNAKYLQATVRGEEKMEWARGEQDA
jgi:hypothetical protein